MNKSILIAFLFFLPSINAQIPAELFFGDKKATLDVLFLNLSGIQREKTVTGFSSTEERLPSTIK